MGKTDPLARKFTFSGNQLALFVSAFVVLGGYLVAQSYAATKPLPATLNATPNPAIFTDSNMNETFTGCGYYANTGTTIVVNTPTAVSFFGGLSDANGCINITHNGFVTQEGTYYVKAWQDSARGQHKATLMGQTTLTVK